MNNEQFASGAREATETSPDVSSLSQLPSFRKHARRYKAQCAALDLVVAPRRAADSELLMSAANAVQESWPRDTHHLEQVLWSSFSKYCTTLFDKIAEARVGEVWSGSSRRRYVHWL